MRRRPCWPFPSALYPPRYCPIKPEGRGTAEHVVMIKPRNFFAEVQRHGQQVRDETEHERPVGLHLASAKAIGGYFTTNFFVPTDLSSSEISTW